MNTEYFACMDCKVIVEAGLRHARILQSPNPRLVQYGGYIDADAILGFSPYWDVPPDDSTEHLRELLEIVSKFLGEHRTHRVMFGDETNELWNLLYDHDAKFINPDADKRLRDLIELDGLYDWNQVCNYMETDPDPPWWWTEVHSQKLAKRKFHAIVNGGTRSPWWAFWR